MVGLRFIKMHGLGNDFVVLDARAAPLCLSAGEARAIADRHTGVGCDQVITVEASAAADAFMRIHNANGTEVEACGNATRCVAAMVMRETGTDRAVIETVAGRLPAAWGPDDTVVVDMGPARLDWRDIPLAAPADTNHLDLTLGPLADPAAVNMGNPHAVFFVADADAVALEELGPPLERHPLFPRGANIGVAQHTGPDRLRLRVWERGVGITRACGSGACAAAVASARRGLTGRRVEVMLDGGALDLEWLEGGHVRMTGPVATSFTGEIDSDRLV